VFNHRNTQSILRIEHLAPTKDLSPRRNFNTASKEYLRILNSAIETHCPGKKLSQIQQYWLSLCIMTIIVTNSVCWSRFKKATMCRYSTAALSWMFRKSKILSQMIRHLNDLRSFQKNWKIM
jgi:hypothetical protein